MSIAAEAIETAPRAGVGLVEPEVNANAAVSAGRDLANLAVAQMQDVLLARFVGREHATRMGFAPASLTRIATAISEMCRNVVQHSGAHGKVSFLEISSNERRGLKIVVEDKGRGIDRLEFLLSNRTQALGAGIPGTRSIVDEFQIESSPGCGTRVTMMQWLPDQLS